MSGNEYDARNFPKEDEGTCPKCHGSGRVGVIHRHNCELCGGTGQTGSGSRDRSPEPGGGFGNPTGSGSGGDGNF